MGEVIFLTGTKTAILVLSLISLTFVLGCMRVFMIFGIVEVGLVLKLLVIYNFCR